MTEGRYVSAAEFFKNSTPVTIGRDVRREMNVRDLLGTYPVDYILQTFDYVTKDWGYTEAKLRAMAPKAIADKEYDRRKVAGIAAIMNTVL